MMETQMMPKYVGGGPVRASQEDAKNGDDGGGEEPTERNTLAAAALFGAAIVCDALTAVDHPLDVELPTALRTSAMLLIACLASPPIRQWLVLEQRVASGLPLALVALLGQQQAALNTRIADTVYCFVALTTIVVVFGDLGLETFVGHGAREGFTATTSRRPKSLSRDASPFVRREAVANVAVAMLAYSSLRNMRRGVWHASAVQGHKVAVSSYDGTRHLAIGYAFANPIGAGALSFGGSAGVVLAATLFTNTEYRYRGTSAASLVLSTSAFAQLAAAFTATMSYSDQLTHLPALHAATASTDAVARQSRRFAASNSASCSLWLTGLGTFVMAYSPAIRIHSREQMDAIRRDFAMVVYCLLTCTVCVLVLVAYLPFAGAGSSTDFASVLAVLALPITAFADSVVGAVVFAAAIASNQALLVADIGFVGVFSHLTHVTNALIVVFLVLYALSSAIADVVWRCVPRHVDLLDALTGIVAVAGTSASALLYCATCALQASYDGTLLTDHDYRSGTDRYARTAAAMIFEHWLAVFIWLPVYARRSEVQQLSARLRGVVWYAVGPVVLVIWVALLLATEESIGHVYAWSTSFQFIFGVVTVGIVPWAAMIWA